MLRGRAPPARFHQGQVSLGIGGALGYLVLPQTQGQAAGAGIGGVTGREPGERG